MAARLAADSSAPVALHPLRTRNCPWRRHDGVNRSGPTVLLQRAFALSTDAVTGRTTHRIVAVSPVGVPEAVYSDLRRSFHQVPASPVVEGFVLATELDAQPYRLVGLDLFAESPSAATLAR